MTLRVSRRAREEADELANTVKTIVISVAKLIAAEDNRRTVDPEDVRKAKRKIRVLYGSKKISWLIRIGLAILAILLGLQITGLASKEIYSLPMGVQLRLWLLPIFLIAWLVILCYLLRDFYR
ncbi:MAG: hypothetical protein OEZ29_03120 [Candidatus Bathyarchaeota archaeon]|nr:hypothetical protein [Candidatus Bathyarchaeota archaeon]